MTQIRSPNRLKDSLGNFDSVKRVRTLHQKTCSEVLALRADAFQSSSVPFDSIESYNEIVSRFRSRHGSDWCADRALIPLPPGFRFTVVMPVFNEQRTISEMIDRVCHVDLPMELVIVDDGSTDGTRDELEKLFGEHSAADGSGEKDGALRSNAFGAIDIRTLFHEVNQGKGAALKTGFQAATGDVVGIQDADQEYDPQEFAVLLTTLLSGEADVVYGSRFAGGNQTNSPAWHRFGNGLITCCSNWMTGLNLSDAETCYKLVRKTILDEIVEGLTEKRFGIELEMTAKLAKRQETRFDERPISYHKRTYAEGKKIGVRDGFRALWCILKY